jgi:HEAT repeat protein
MVACTIALAAAVLLSSAAQRDANAAAAGLASPDPDVRTRAACELRDMGQGAASALARLATLLDDGSPVDRTVCGDRTWRFGAERDTTTPGEQAATAMVAIGSDAYPPFVKALAGPAWIARRNAAWGLGALDESQAVPALIEALRDPEASVREQVAWALGAIGDRRAVNALIVALKDPSPAVRRQAAWALGAIGG